MFSNITTNTHSTATTATATATASAPSGLLHTIRAGANHLKHQLCDLAQNKNVQRGVIIAAAAAIVYCLYRHLQTTTGETSNIDESHFNPETSLFSSNGISGIIGDSSDSRCVNNFPNIPGMQSTLCSLGGKKLVLERR